MIWTQTIKITHISSMHALWFDLFHILTSDPSMLYFHVKNKAEIELYFSLSMISQFLRLFINIPFFYPTT